jgi:lipoyl(octanoyl) transferase
MFRMNTILNKQVQFQQLGLADYQQTWDYQEQLLADTVKIKTQNRDLPAAQQLPTPNYLLFCEHEHVYTLGKSGHLDNLLLQEEALAEKNAKFYKINRGGDITYHGPGQLVVYPVLDLENFFNDIHRYMRTLEEAVILTCADYGLSAGRIQGFTGVWLDHETQQNPRKICAMGVKTSRWVTMHGLAFNVNTDLSYFDYIVPCGIADKAVTSLQAELGVAMNLEEVAQKLKAHLGHLFEIQYVNGD